MKKIWIASLLQGLTSDKLEVFDNEADARNYAQEMEASGKGEYNVIESPVNSRAEKIEGEPHWVDFANLNAFCIECLLEDFGAMKGMPIDEEACAEFLGKHKDELQKKSDEMVHEYLRKAISDYVNNERIVLG